MLPWIDAMRGLAILMVLANHVALQVPGLSGPLRALASFGQMGVQLFFVASAYTLCLSWQQRRGNERRPLLSFLLRRFFRIAPLYWFAIALFFGLGLLLAEQQTGSPYNWANIWANVFFVHGLLPAAQNSVVPGGWSIGVEMVFYLLFPALLALHLRLLPTLGRWTGPLLVAIACGLNLLWQTGSVGNNSAAYFHPINQIAVFLIGLSWFEWQRGAASQMAPKPALECLIAGLAFAVTALLWRSGLALAFALLPMTAGLGFAALGQLCSQWSRLPAALLALGRASYAVYIIHILFAWHGLHALQSVQPLQGDLAYLLALGLVTLLSYGAARLLGLAIERPGIGLGARLIHRINRPAQLSSQGFTLLKGLK
ncbi:acyltransferase family protein [Roseateles oligotrophus]|uniref:Acyltransferase n=1 Tax=Roseateles oligotrophus TaxID=1769250 RepID=A0ABT2YFR4_9BURK|nr:acyltransferase [Roseateles oligotrophus]MCV2368884.1 acyltransferase [Roseateles oligotrophus]